MNPEHAAGSNQEEATSDQVRVNRRLGYHPESPVHNAESSTTSSDASSDGESNTILAKIIHGEVPQPKLHGQQYFVPNSSQLQSRSDTSRNDGDDSPKSQCSPPLSSKHQNGSRIASHLDALLELPDIP